MNPFDDEQKLKELLQLRKNGEKFLALAVYFNTSYSTVYNTLLYRKLPKETTEHKINKYDFLFDEPTNIGKTYEEYLKEYKLKVPKSFWGKV